MISRLYPACDKSANKFLEIISKINHKCLVKNINRLIELEADGINQTFVKVNYDRNFIFWNF